MKSTRFPSIVVAIVLFAFPVAAHAQRANPPANQPRTPAPATTASGSPADLAAQIAELRSAIARLEASMGASQQTGSRPAATSGGMPGVGGMKGGMMGRKQSAGMGGGKMSKGASGGMKGGMMDDDMGEMPPASGAAMAVGMDGMDSGEMSMEVGMMGMGSMGQQGSSNMLRVSSLPGFPGASHIYHIGATGLFLDHPDHVSLDTAQQQELNRLKQGALLAKASAQRKINEAEQQLWELTAADEPDAEQIKTKVDEIASLRAQQRLDFIRAVGEGAKVLTDEQREAFLGTAADKPGTHAGH